MQSTRRHYAAFFALLVLVFSSIASLGCEDPPLPLRRMYLESDVIVVGRIGKPGKWMAGAREGEANTQYQIFNRSFPITVEKVLKGDANGKLALSEENYHYLGNGGDVSAKPGDRINEPEYESELTKDSGRRLFFLKKNEQGLYTEIYSNRDFAPKGKDLDIFISRIGELSEMYRNGEPSKARIVEWLVSMTENPVTRFDGAYELRTSLYDLKYQGEEAAEQAPEAGENDDHQHSLKEALAQQEASENSAGPENSEEEAYRSYGEAEFARLLTGEQKARLIKAFFSVKYDYEPKKNEYADNPDETYISVLNEGDSHLIDTVVLLGDRRAINRILAELPNLARHESYTAASLLELISGQLKNEKFTGLVGKYSEVAYGGEDEMIETKAAAYDVESLEGTEEEKAAQLANLPNKTYGARRAELLGQISASLNQQTAKK
ncbi:MAG TPA: hypothetical protein VGO50_20150 [Pyrinomonadaceae bacterium]|jgi:hypothetical protein|nr:hypothetical protein [Pyrinomonadaceae bacterium]